MRARSGYRSGSWENGRGAHLKHEHYELDLCVGDSLPTIGSRRWNFLFGIRSLLAGAAGEVEITPASETLPAIAPTRLITTAQTADGGSP